jgi:hypothetical protein
MKSISLPNRHLRLCDTFWTFSPSATFDRIAGAKRWAGETETAIRAGRWFQQVEAKRNSIADLIGRYHTDTQACVRTTARNT